MTEGKRLLSVFIAPNSLFEDLREGPRWLVPFLVLILVAAVAAVLPRLLISADIWLGVMRDRLPEGMAMSAEQMMTMAQQMSSPIALAGVAVSVTVLNSIVTFASALLFWALFAFFGTESSYKKTLAVVAYSGLITALGMILLSVLAISFQRLDITTSLAFLSFLDQDTFLYRFAAQIDFFTVWRVLIMGAGFAVVTNTRKFTSCTIVIVLWLALSLLLSLVRLGGAVR